MWRLLRPDAITVWNVREVRERLDWYFKVMVNDAPAKYKISKYIEVHEDPKKLEYKELWNLHDKLSKEFDGLFREVDSIGFKALKGLERPKWNFIDLKAEIAYRMLKSCTFCERKCGVDRASGNVGVCRLNARTYVSTWFHHYGEEAPLVPSGTIFYGGCNFRCAFCIDGEESILVRENGRVKILKVKEAAERSYTGSIEVLSLNGWKRVKHFIKRTSRRIYRVICGSGHEVKLTGDHVVITFKNGRLTESRTDQLKVGDKIITINTSYVPNITPIDKLNLMLELIERKPTFLGRIHVRRFRGILKKIMQQHGMKFKDVLKKLSMDGNSKYNWLYNDSIPLTHFYQLYKTFNLKVKDLRGCRISIRGTNSYLAIVLSVNQDLLKLLAALAVSGRFDGEKIVIKVNSKEHLEELYKVVQNLCRKCSVSTKHANNHLELHIKSKLMMLILKHVFEVIDEDNNIRMSWLPFNIDEEKLKLFISYMLRYTSNGGSTRTLVVNKNVKDATSYMLSLNGLKYRILQGHNGNVEFQIVGPIENCGEKPSIDTISKIQVLDGKREVYDIIIDDSSEGLKDHVFFAGTGILVHNCQNWDISQVNPKGGVAVDGKKLALIQRNLREDGARNINHVGGEPTPNLHTILDSLRYLEINTPQLWNSNMYCTLETMKLLREVIDIWLPDFKYGNDKCGKRLSAVFNYWRIVTRNIKLAHEWSDIIVRHLVLPNHLECCTKPILEWISKNLPRALVNIMEQYRPEYLVAKHPKRWRDIARRPTSEEMREAYEYAKELGIVFEPIS